MLRRVSLLGTLSLGLFFTCMFCAVSPADAITMVSNKGRTIEISDSLFQSPYEEAQGIVYDLEPIKPMSNPSEDPRVKSIFGNDDIYEVQNSLTYPYSTSVLIQSALNGNTYRGSGNFIGDKVILTCAHVLFDLEAKKFYSIAISPAHNADKEPFGSEVPEEVFVPQRYRSLNNDAINDAERLWDIGIIITKKPYGAITGSLGFKSLQGISLAGRSAHIVGYPCKTNERKLWMSDGAIMADKAGLLHYQIDTLGGSSGSAVYDDSYNVLGIHVLGGRKNPYNYAVKADDAAARIIYAFAGNNAIMQTVFNEDPYDGWIKRADKWSYFEKGVCYFERWVPYGSDWYYIGKDGFMIRSSWLQHKGYWYHFDDKGVMEKDGWIKLKDLWYYLDAEGKMASDRWVNTSGKWYYVNNQGVMLKEQWLSDKGKWYYLNSEGDMAVNKWVQTKGKWYYLGSDGVMYKNKTATIDGKRYRFDSTGALVS